ncbi:MAG: hypothetical protein JWP92_1520 [Caulobacter sp.]|nr:hypothetical protein [Caulobacter sp.]
MKTFNLVTLILTIAAGLDVGLVGLAEIDLIAYLFGEGSMMARGIYVILGLSALYQIYPFVKAWSVGEIHAEAAHT